MSSGTKKGYDWIVLNAAHGGRLECLRCGRFHEYETPIEIWALSALGAGFEKEHKGCKLKPEGLHCSFCGGLGHGPTECPRTKVTTPEAWLFGPDTGISSKTIWSVMTGKDGLRSWGASPPLDPDDFGRCYRLLKLFPEWRSRMPEVALKYPDWAGLVANWAELEMLYETEIPRGVGAAPRLYARMKEARGR